MNSELMHEHQFNKTEADMIFDSTFIHHQNGGASWEKQVVFLVDIDTVLCEEKAGCFCCTTTSGDARDGGRKNSNTTEQLYVFF